MSERSRAVAFLAVSLVIIWILMNSITPLIVRTSGAKASTNKLVNVGESQMPGIGSGIFGWGIGITGIGIGISGIGIGIGLHGIGLGGVGTGGLGSMPTPYMPFVGAPMLSPTLSPTPPKIQSQQLPSLEIRTSRSAMAFGNALIITPLPKPGGGGGGGGGAGSSGAVNKGPVGNEVVKTVIIRLFLSWLLWVLIALIAVLLIFTIISSRNSLLRLRRMVEEREEREAERRPRVKAVVPRPSEGPVQAIQGVGMTISGTPVPLRGWGGSRYIDLGIDKDLPLTWRVNDPLPYSTSSGVTIELYPEGEASGGAIIFHSPGCHEVRVRLGDNVVEVHRVLVVEDYGIDVLNTFRANMAMHGVKDLESKTPREVCRELAGQGLMSEVNCEGWVSLRIFEDVRYGHAQVGRREYEDFVRGLARLSNALVMGCPG